MTRKRFLDFIKNTSWDAKVRSTAKVTLTIDVILSAAKNLLSAV
jgi:hypothetical protein